MDFNKHSEPQRNWKKSFLIISINCDPKRNQTLKIVRQYVMVHHDLHGFTPANLIIKNIQIYNCLSKDKDFGKVIKMVYILRFYKVSYVLCLSHYKKFLRIIYSRRFYYFAMKQCRASLPTVFSTSFFLPCNTISCYGIIIS